MTDAALPAAPTATQADELDSPAGKWQSDSAEFRIIYEQCQPHFASDFHRQPGGLAVARREGEIGQALEAIVGGAVCLGHGARDYTRGSELAL